MAKILEILRSLIPSLEGLPGISSVSGIGPGWMFGMLGAIAISLFGLSLGRTRAVISLLSMYVAFVISRIFPFSQEVTNVTGNSFDGYWLKLGIFIASYIGVFLIFNFSFIRKRISQSEFNLFGIIILSALQLGFFVSIVFNILPESFSGWLSGMGSYFDRPQALFFWAIAPLTVLVFIKRK